MAGLAPLFVLTVVSGVALCRFAAWLEVALPWRLPGKKPSVIIEGKTIKFLLKTKVFLKVKLS